jgi:hemerythrin
MLINGYLTIAKGNIMLAWKDSMTTGIKEIDAQHKELINRYNAFADVLSNSKDTAILREEAGGLLDFLQFYALWHFTEEEEFFEKYQCPDAEVNKKAHAQFIEMFGQFHESWQDKGMDLELAQRTFTELGNWVANHILGVDIKVYPYVKAEMDSRPKDPTS